VPTSDEPQLSIGAFFDHLYEAESRYWWREDIRYSARPDDYPHSLITQVTLRVLARQRMARATRRPLRALDLGAGEGADAIRLALLGYQVEAVEISDVGAKKIAKYAADAGVDVRVHVADVRSYLPEGRYDVVLCNGLLHYIEDKQTVVERMQKATTVGGLNVVSLWSTYSEVPDSHRVVPVYCDDENGIVRKMYEGWDMELCYFERRKPESSHDGMPEHSHSHIKLAARKT
jgi:SAM-dependent methyltransferase